jgi:hypothetical protein
MILKLFKNLILALLLDAAGAPVFKAEETPQSCTLPVPGVEDHTTERDTMSIRV